MEVEGKCHLLVGPAIVIAEHATKDVVFLEDPFAERQEHDYLISRRISDNITTTTFEPDFSRRREANGPNDCFLVSEELKSPTIGCFLADLSPLTLGEPCGMTYVEWSWSPKEVL